MTNSREGAEGGIDLTIQSNTRAMPMSQRNDTRGESKLWRGKVWQGIRIYQSCPPVSTPVRPEYVLDGMGGGEGRAETQHSLASPTDITYKTAGIVSF